MREASGMSGLLTGRSSLGTLNQGNFDSEDAPRNFGKEEAMKAIVMSGFGEADVLNLGEIPDPVPREDELLVGVRAAALNRADLFQRRGRYNPPPGAPSTLGLEMAGVVERVGADCAGWKVGDRVCALLPGGGYAERVVVPSGMAIPIPESLSDEQAAAIPEVFLTAYLNLFRMGSLQRGQTVLIHAGASGVGTAAIQLVREAGAVSFVTAGSPSKIERCLGLGAAGGWNHRQGTFLPWILEKTQARGVDLVLDFVGAPYFADNLKALALDGRLCIIGTLGGTVAENVDLGLLMSKRLTVRSTGLRSLASADKVGLTRDLTAWALPLFAARKLSPVIDRVFPWSEAAEAHRYMESDVSVGKIVLRVG
jgi:putative PIG3 family NAD(P)H quinone oxidoreductase